MHASLTFEQLYGDIDGDSASSTEVYAILSALSGVPIYQGIAVTGSVNQRGEVQPIGGATAKIEGFYEVCRARGLDGKQGVMIPAANVENVVLRPEVARAVREGKFHVWAVSTIEEGIEVLTGVQAGVRGEDGQYTEGSVFRRVEERLEAYYHALEQHREAGGIVEQPRPVMPEQPQPPPPGTPPPPPPPPPVQV
jgi:Lon-like ATP-dependent protease